MSEKDWLREFCDLVDEAGGFTFSVNCCSGLTKSCRCWRCAGVDQSDEDPTWADEAKRLTAEHHKRQREWIQGMRKGMAKDET